MTSLAERSTPAPPTSGRSSRKFAVKDVLDPSYRTVIFGILGLWALLYLLNPRFLTPGNLTNLGMQIATVAVLSLAALIVLLMGDIDLSLGSVSGLCAAVMAVLTTSYGVPAPLAIVAALVAGFLIGILHGTVITVFAIPSFVVTLGGLLTWQGAQLAVLGDQGNINITDNFLIRLTSTYLPNAIGIGIGLLAVAAVLFFALRRMSARKKHGLPVRSVAGTVARALPMIVSIVLLSAILLAGRGFPLVLIIVAVIATALHVVLTSRPVGRHIYAIGSNIEAARRTGIRVDLVKVFAFGATSTLAAAGGVLAASRLLAVNQSSGQGNLLLLAIAGAVIGGVSLFGGVGSVWHAILGTILIGSIANGMNLLSMPTSYRFVVTGAVLVLAVVIDAFSRKRAAHRGLA
jgi:D-xylose transport system permease protein